ncbi:MAG TPA: hypothetical protein VGM12_05135 [Trebonia sp.]
MKNVTQVFLIAASAAAGVDAAAVEADAVGVGEADGVAGADVLAAAVGEAGAELLLELLELEHAVSAAAKARPNAGTSRARRAL